jgi:hypothetical protein
MCCSILSLSWIVIGESGDTPASRRIAVQLYERFKRQDVSFFRVKGALFRHRGRLFLCAAQARCRSAPFPRVRNLHSLDAIFGAVKHSRP